MSLPLLHVLIFRLLFVFAGSTVGDPGPPKNYPIPPPNENSLFYVQRSSNTNAIVYDANVTRDGNLNETEPVKIYWLRYAEDSTTEDLNYIQRKYAYGINAKAMADQKNKYILQFVSYAKKHLYLMAKPNGKYAAYMNINGKLAELKRVWIQLNGGTFWFPTIEYVELVGKDPTTQQTVIERFKPKR